MNIKQDYTEVWQRNLQYTAFKPYPRIQENDQRTGAYVFSSAFRTTDEYGIGVSQYDYYLQVGQDGGTGSTLRIYELWIDGVKQTQLSGTGSGTDAMFLIPPASQDRFIEVRMSYLAPNRHLVFRIGTMQNGNGYVANLFTRFYLWFPKLEDVTGLPESKQRATPWVKHNDDVE